MSTTAIECYEQPNPGIWEMDQKSKTSLYSLQGSSRSGSREKAQTSKATTVPAAVLDLVPRSHMVAPNNHL